MPPEIVAVITGIAVAAGIGIQQLIKATVNRRIKAMEDTAEDERKERETKRQRELEEMRQKTAKAQEDAEQAKAIGENLTNLTSAVLQMVQVHSKEQHANREVLVNNTQTVGDLSESVDKIAMHVGENNKINKEVIKAVDRLYDRFALLFPTDKPAVEQIRDGIIDMVNKVCDQKKTDSQEIAVITPPPPGAVDGAAA